MRSVDPPPRPDQSPVSARTVLRSRWPLALVGFGVGVGVVLLIGGLLSYVRHDHPGGFIDDRAFVEAANAACRNTRSALPPPAGESATLEDRAETVEEIYALFDALVADLADLPVVEMDREEVAWWIARWRQFLAIGPEYAAAIRTGDPEVYTVIGDLGDDPSREANEFADRNGLDACVF